MSGPQFDNTNRGALFTNRSKRSDRQPDFTGTLDVGGSKFELAAWSQTSKKGTPYLALRVSPQRETDRGNGAPFNDEIPY